MSAWKEWQLAEKAGDREQAEISRMEYESECRREAEMDAYYEDQMYGYEEEEDDEE